MTTLQHIMITIMATPHHDHNNTIWLDHTYATSCHVMPYLQCCIVLCRGLGDIRDLCILSCHTMSYYTIPHHTLICLPYYIKPFHTTPYLTISCPTIPHNILLCLSVLCQAIPRYTIPNYTLLCHTIPGYAICAIPYMTMSYHTMLCYTC